MMIVLFGSPTRLIDATVRKSEDVPKIVQNNFTPVHELLELTFTQASRFLRSSTQAIPTSSTKS
jgi:hypothetical protein